ncbi:MAG: hypothetical protein A2622_05315 [Bdellovibrionales bacterium RIFCSPHIGHO2_01_FULL_40_29]|nr:MAG: hypothetical protein A2622_05315 [Bdellovibrionales bacterium RIFCSPHIGHO2_01_FULL_40_29]OFZ34658.1 MAG: hypothetical protein A3D17_10060 [Bdellovibrionales bacterium RIFCSPHIGHO2_02_FULL_40_15]
MRFELEVLDGTQKGRRIALRRGLVIGRQTGDITFPDRLMAESHGVLVFDHKKTWNIECLSPYKARLGSSEQARISLLPGLVFHLGQTGFKVVEKEALLYESWDEGVVDWLRHHHGEARSKEFFFFLRPVSLNFTQGPQYEEFLVLSYGPRLLGHDSLDINLIDPSLPKEVARFFQIADQCYIENLCREKALINLKPFDQHPIQDGDLLKIGSTIIELSVQK